MTAKTPTKKVVEVPREGLATIREACDFLSVGTTKLYELLGEGLLGDPVHIGRARRVPWPRLHKYLATLQT